METSENVEAVIVLGETIAAAVTTYILALPIPVEIKAPTAAFVGSVALAVFVFWKTRVNKPK